MRFVPADTADSDFVKIIIGKSEFVSLGEGGKVKEMKKKIIAILGDSVSTYEGYTPEGFVFYGPWNAVYTGVASVEDTWWMKVIRALDGQPGSNNSLAGSLVCGRSRTSATSPDRIADLCSHGMPDVILVAMGANDWGFGFLPEEFEGEYRRMLHLLKVAYPEAEIWCATLPESKVVNEEDQFFFDVDARVSKRVYSDIIKRVAMESEVRLADLYGCGREYHSLDGVHPDKEGMTDLADMWIDSCYSQPFCL